MQEMQQPHLSQTSQTTTGPTPTRATDAGGAFYPSRKTTKSHLVQAATILFLLIAALFVVTAVASEDFLSTGASADAPTADQDWELFFEESTGCEASPLEYEGMEASTFSCSLGDPFVLFTGLGTPGAEHATLLGERLGDVPGPNGCVAMVTVDEWILSFYATSPEWQATSTRVFDEVIETGDVVVHSRCS